MAGYHRGNTASARAPRPKRTMRAPLALKPPQPDGRPGGGHEAKRRHRVALARVSYDVRAFEVAPVTARDIGRRPGECKCPLPHNREMAVGSVHHPDILIDHPAGRSQPPRSPQAPLVGASA